MWIPRAHRIRILAATLPLLALSLTAPAEAFLLGKLAARGASRIGGVGKPLPRPKAPVVWDRARDRATPAHRLQRERSAVRYTTTQQAVQERRHKIAAGRHMAPAQRGRPLSAMEAQRRYGLPHRPEVVERITLPKGQPVRSNKAVGGRPGYGELTSPNPVPSHAIKGVHPLP